MTEFFHAQSPICSLGIVTSISTVDAILDERSEDARSSCYLFFNPKNIP